MQNVPSETNTERFKADLARVTRGRLDARFGLCVSGGPDSLALMILALGAGIDCEAATVDHGLRPEGATEARFVVEVAENLGIDHQILTLASPPKGNVSAWARDQRYQRLQEWANARSIDWLLTAHHADDQLETIIMRLNRGSGVAGLAGVRPAQNGIARPLLGWRKAELEQMVANFGLVPVDDPSNRDDRFDRARLRKELAAADWLDPVAASKSAAALAEAESALEWTAQAYVNRRVAEQNGVISCDAKGLPRELQRRIVLHCLRQVSAHVHPRGDELDRLLSGLEGGKVATLGGVKCSGGTFWLFEKAPDRAKT